jgi:hypothetical protein
LLNAIYSSYYWITGSAQNLSRSQMLEIDAVLGVGRPPRRTYRSHRVMDFFRNIEVGLPLPLRHECSNLDPY